MKEEEKKFVVALLIICLLYTAVIWSYTNHFYGATMLALIFWSSYWFRVGTKENSVDRLNGGLRRVFRSLPWFILLAAIACLCCSEYMPWLFG